MGIKRVLPENDPGDNIASRLVFCQEGKQVRAAAGMRDGCAKIPYKILGARIRLLTTTTIGLNAPSLSRPPQQTTSAATTTATTMAIASQQMASVGAQAIILPVLSATQTTLLALRVLSPFLVLLSAISLLPARPPAPKSPSPITSVVVAARIPRRALILSLLSLSALSFLLDGLTFVVYAVFDKQWPQWTGIEVAAVEGLVAFSGLAALGAWKDVQGVEVWLTKRLRAAVTWALFLDIAQVVLLGLAVRSKQSD